ncbi:MAG TPA: DUF5675 family protein [Pyrinomonadaceae bacterium]
MDLKLVRKIFTEQSTVGELSVDGRFECFTLEDKVRPVKVHGETAIPEGIYEVIINFSPRFKRQLPRLLNVAGFEGILIHPGNKAADTDGCILVGTTKSKDFVGNSRVAFKALFDKLVAGGKKGKIHIEVVGKPGGNVVAANAAGTDAPPSDVPEA